MNYSHLLESILKYTDEGILVVDTNANVVLYNEPATSIAGISQEEAIGKNILEIFPDLTPETSTFYRVLKSNEAIIDYVQTYQNYKGQMVTTVTTTIPLIEDGTQVGALEIYRNFSQVKELSEKLIKLQHELYNKNLKKKHYEGNGTSFTIDDIIGESNAIDRLKKQIRIIANSPSSVLVCGETGTGKELVVQAIHNDSYLRRAKPFIAQNCAALPATLLEGILFGTASGSFTGAVDKPGLFELADGGTLFLDEINSMDMQLQGKLLRVLQDGIIRRVGGTKTITVDVRVIASTNKDPITAVEGQTLREDLYYRLNVLSIELPPLRRRKEDIPLLTSYYINYYNNKLNKRVKGSSSKATEALCSYDWPGNIRELKYVIEGMMHFIDKDFIQQSDLPINIINKRILNNEIEENKNKQQQLSLKEELSEYEKQIIEMAIEKTNGNCAKAARILNVPKQTLHNKIKKHGIEWKTIIDE
ncbi:sigma-54 interaction domain-containing protein [Alkaliphilus peptidifermentans]|uniref:Arginine utilization regulatory protein n=1 Tax=Alkaliphilus peptidifermentans DSM 18978 TaxID=1120976 RepID=A0A1G5CW39_9FIRM|nr:sigma 54-interacting transcriptional regulator [Alkaliphilus peptidifermentans]SCY06468.1 arginine utilization regulatory protein [Alkaliphilus peptidifermentans DSM 18978]